MATAASAVRRRRKRKSMAAALRHGLYYSTMGLDERRRPRVRKLAEELEAAAMPRISRGASGASKRS